MFTMGAPLIKNEHNEKLGGEKSVILHTMSRVSGRCLADCRSTRDVAALR